VRIDKVPLCLDDLREGGCCIAGAHNSIYSG
jgi:hypothetical protein